MRYIMRLKNVKNAKNIIEEGKYYVNKPCDYKGKWHELFQNDNPIYLEIGMGKGKFILENALQNTDVNYIGIEKYDSVLVRAIQKTNKFELNNLKLIKIDALNLSTIFDKEIDLIYLNFSDPWPKDRHARRRLTSSEFLARYDRILVPDGTIEFKTDNRGLFDFSLEEINASDVWKVTAHTFDLHHTPEMFAGNIMTEYEEKFSSQGNPICKLIAARKN